MISAVRPVVHDADDKKEWFETWFDSVYYHILYKDRDLQEAESFLDRLIDHLKPVPNARILDVACGRGRHAVHLFNKGFNVTGFDLSENSILYDKQFEKERLEFFVHDMREIFRVNYFNFVLNLFSSFGYFEKDRDNLRCLMANATALKPGGIFVFDYFNAHKILNAGPSEIIKEIDGIVFHIQKKIENNLIKKTIEFTDLGQNFHFEEQLVLTQPEVFKEYFKSSGLTIIETFGSYHLDPFDPDHSDRLIIVSKK